MNTIPSIPLATQLVIIINAPNKIFRQHKIGSVRPVFYAMAIDKILKFLCKFVIKHLFSFLAPAYNFQRRTILYNGLRMAKFLPTNTRRYLDRQLTIVTRMTCLILANTWVKFTAVFKNFAMRLLWDVLR
jgi:hypothetical protein